MSRCPLCCSKVGRTARHDPSSPSARTIAPAGSLMGAGSSQVAAEPHDVVQHLGDQALASESARTIPPSPPCSDVNRSHTFAEAETEKPSAEMDKPRTEPAEPVRAAFEVEIVKRWAEQPIGLTLEGEGGPPFVKSVAEFSLVQDSKRIHPSQVRRLST